MDANFAALGLCPPLLQVLEQSGLTTPTPIQSQAIPLLLDGADLIASAPTGTGKTAAFLLPALQRLTQPSEVRSRGPRVLVLTPTRELAQQVSKAAIGLSRTLSRVKTVCITGGESYRTQGMALASPFEILVATPGRLMDQMGSGRIDFSRLEVLVLDEADRMLDMGFADDVLAIAAQLPKERQTVCFTATLSPDVQRLSRQLQKNAQIIEVAAAANRHEQIDQHVVYADGYDHKRRLLDHWLATPELGQAVVFIATKRDVEKLAEALDADGHECVALHGDLQQRERTRMLNRLRKGEARILVATDVAARGIDVPTITHVFNFDLPRVAEDYVHRIGRTGRAGASGMAVSFVGRDDVFLLRRIERFIGDRVKVTAVTGLESRFKPDARPSGPRRSGPFPGKGEGQWNGQKRQGQRDGGRPFGAQPGFGEKRFGARKDGADGAAPRHDGQRPGGYRGDGFRHDAPRVDNPRSGGFRAEGFPTNAPRGDGYRKDGQRTDGNRFDGQRADAKRPARNDQKPAWGGHKAPRSGNVWHNDAPPRQRFNKG